MTRGSQYSDDQVKSGLRALAKHGSSYKASKATGIPARTLRDWKARNLGGEWITAAEAAEILGLSKSQVQKLCRRGRFECKRQGDGANPNAWAISRANVEAMARPRRERKAHLLLGEKLCSRCGKWKKRSQFHRDGRNRRKSKCKACINRERPQRTVKPSVRGGTPFGRGEQVGGPLEDYVRTAQGPPPGPGDSLRYRCMKKANYTRGIPRGMTKRQAYCAECTADHCVHYGHLTPADLCFTARVERRVEHSAGMSAASSGDGPVGCAGTLPDPDSL